MAGRLVVSTLNNDTGVLNVQNGMTGIAKAWVNFNGTTSPGTIRDSFNVASVTKNGTGDYTINFTTAMPNANYAVMGTGGNATGAGLVYLGPRVSAPTTSAVRLYAVNASDVLQDVGYVGVAIFSS